VVPEVTANLEQLAALARTTMTVVDHRRRPLLFVP
jgi:hypothetical protein